MSYEEKSDPEINAEVTCIVFGLQGWEFSENTQCFYHCGLDGNETHTQGVIDFCNNPNDAWPIIFDTGISLESDDIFNESHKAGVSIWAAYNPERSHYHHTNPLRAAMITFLMMKGGSCD